MQRFEPPEIIAPFVKEIFILESTKTDQERMPFYADGYPGILFSETPDGVRLLPIDKILPDFFLYGQTIEPIVLELRVPYHLVVYQLYPFATRLLIGIDPKEINDACYDLQKIEGVDTAKTTEVLQQTDQAKRIDIISDYVLELIENSSSNPDKDIKMVYYRTYFRKTICGRNWRDT